MATMNILTSSINGKLGTAYGTKQYGNHYIKAVPFSHTPHNQTQKDSFTAFGCLQRYSAQLAKNFWPYLNLSDKGLQRINAVAAAYKKLISEHEFDANKIKIIYPIYTVPLHISPKFDKERQAFRLGVRNIGYFYDQRNTVALTFVNGIDGQGYGTMLTKQTVSQISIPTEFRREQNVTITTIIVEKIKNAWRGVVAYVSFLRFDVYYNNGWYVDNMRNGKWSYQDPNGLYGEGVEYSYSDGGLTIPKVQVIL